MKKAYCIHVNGSEGLDEFYVTTKAAALKEAKRIEKEDGDYVSDITLDVFTKDAFLKVLNGKSGYVESSTAIWTNPKPQPE